MIVDNFFIVLLGFDGMRFGIGWSIGMNILFKILDVLGNEVNIVI